MRIDTFQYVEDVNILINVLCIMSGRNHNEFMQQFNAHLSKHSYSALQVMHFCYYCYSVGIPMPWEDGHNEAHFEYVERLIEMRKIVMAESERSAQLQNAILEQAAIRVDIRLSGSYLMSRLEEVETYTRITNLQNAILESAAIRMGKRVQGAYMPSRFDKVNSWVKIP